MDEISEVGNYKSEDRWVRYLNGIWFMIVEDSTNGMGFGRLLGWSATCTEVIDDYDQNHERAKMVGSNTELPLNAAIHITDERSVHVPIWATSIIDSQFSSPRPDRYVHICV